MKSACCGNELSEEHAQGLKGRMRRIKTYEIYAMGTHGNGLKCGLVEWVKKKYVFT